MAGICFIFQLGFGLYFSWDLLYIFAGIWFVSQEWQIESEKWVANRAESATFAIEEKIKNMLQPFISMSGRWDVEGLKLTTMKVMTELDTMAT